MKSLIFLLIVGLFAVTPVYLYETFVTPELNNLANQYSSFDQTAQDIASGKNVAQPDPSAVTQLLQ